ncbi:MAG: hypothetical protein JWN39_3169, partial [Ilumatobacteraceae bacterium]|nr:hypothetical protein [Ilumatobacteraceae bacterium]
MISRRDPLPDSRSISRRCAGAPDDFIGERPVKPVIHPAGLPINNLLRSVLRRPVESALRAVIGVMNDIIGVPGAGQRHRQRGHGQDRVLGVAGVPTDDAVMEQITDPGQMQLALSGREHREIRDPSLVRGGSDEVTTEQVLGRVTVVAGLLPSFAGMRATQTVDAHDPGHTRTRDAHTTTTELALHAWDPVGATRGVVDLDDLGEQHGIGEFACSRGPRRPRIERRSRDLDQATHPLDRELGLVVLDEAEADHRIVSRAKYAAARRRISLSVRSSITS